MPFFEMLPGGMPAGLQSDMNAVLNKKFGTSQDYAPETWPDTVNLMGPLEEKTVSGSVVAFSDGADDVPLKSCAVTIAPTLDGVSSVGVVSAGKNLANIGAVESCTNTSGTGSSITQNNNGTITVVTGTQANVKSLQKLRDIAPYLIIGQTYKLSANSTGTTKYIYMHQASQTWTFDGNKTITQEMLDSDISFYASGANGTTAVISDFQIEVGSTATAYTEYVEPTTHTATLGRTIYGGTADIVNGEGKETFARIDMGDLTWQYDSANTRFFTVGLTSVIEKGSSGWKTELVTDLYTTASGTANDKTISEYASTGYVYIKDTDYSDPTQFKNHVSGHYLVYPLATATDFTFTPITPTPETALGDNTMWSDDGDLSVIYRSMGTVYQYTEGEEVYF